MSHAHEKEYWLGGSSLTQEPILFCMHTANAATASEKHSAFQLGVREPVGMANCVVYAYGECRNNLIHLFYAAMAELADAADLGSVGQPPCRFKSC